MINDMMVDVDDTGFSKRQMEARGIVSFIFHDVEKSSTFLIDDD